MTKDVLKSLVYKHWKNIALLALSFFLFKSCNGSSKSQLANQNLKKQVSELIVSSDKYIDKINALSDTIVLLEAKKQKVKVEIVYIENKTKSDIKKVPTLNTKQIANYYQDRYKLPTTITQYGVALSDTIAKKNIVELIEKDGCFAEVKLFKVQLKLEEKKGIVKDTIISDFYKSDADLNRAIYKQRIIIENTEKSLLKEKNKKTFWKVATGAVVVGASYLLITQ